MGDVGDTTQEDGVAHIERAADFTGVGAQFEAEVGGASIDPGIGAVVAEAFVTAQVDAGEPVALQGKRRHLLQAGQGLFRRQTARQAQEQAHVNRIVCHSPVTAPHQRLPDLLLAQAEIRVELCGNEDLGIAHVLACQILNDFEGVALDSCRGASSRPDVVAEELVEGLEIGKGPLLRQPGLVLGQFLAARMQLLNRAPAEDALEVQVHLRFGQARQTRFQVRIVQPAATYVGTAHTALLDWNVLRGDNYRHFMQVLLYY